MVLCLSCKRPWDAKFVSDYVCRLCRCADCQMVFGVECDCGIVHAVPSKSDPRICKECIGIRERVSVLDEDELEYRRIEFENEDKLYE